MTHRYTPTLLLALPFIVAMAPAFASPGRSIDVTVSRSVISPGHIVVHAGERVRMRVTSADGARAFQIKKLGLRGHIPAGDSVAFDLHPTDAGTFEIESFDDGGVIGGGVTARFVVKE